ncbi:MAG: TonB family protein [Elusimicrobiota bacterium]|nr:TonB family protein [Elusimicrobiota bacterium]
MKPAVNKEPAVYTIDFIGMSSKPMRYGAPEEGGSSARQQPAAAKPADEGIKTAAPPPAKKEPAKPAYNSKEQIAKNAKKNTKKNTPAKKEPAKPAKEEKIVLSKPSILGDIDSSNIDPSSLHSLSSGDGGNNAVRASFTNFPYPWYITQVRDALGREWYKRMPKKTGLSALVSFTIDRHGAIYGVQIEQSSGNESYDYAAMSAAGNSAPYPPLPAGFGRDILTVTVEFKNEE